MLENEKDLTKQIKEKKKTFLKHLFIYYTTKGFWDTIIFDEFIADLVFCMVNITY